MASFSAYPPFVHHPSAPQPLDVTTAHTMLSTFLQLANLDPAYRPDSILSERGPESNSSAGNPNLTLHHLNRIKLGLEGVNLGVEDLEAGGFGNRRATGDRDSGAKKRKWQNRDSDVPPPVRAGSAKVVSTADEDVDAVLTAQHADAEQAQAAAAATGQGWQDREDFELAQDDGDVDLNNAQRDPAAGSADVEGKGEEIMDWDTGQMVTMPDELEDGGSAVEVTRPGAMVDAHPENQERNQPPMVRDRPLTEMEKEERKRLKKIRSDNEKKTATTRKPKERSKLTSKLGNGNDKAIEASFRRKKAK
ncbi:hypothetical protein EPUS_00193 [Endocarpon pusillum Z07020]|uniref:Uncharacterized protein n=1 Tax=Endocarpon pusillum (strain Z07020 / HMAS-L-300199) TaxID=1263415 RepID=U1HX61_ENDPU|nr:uncharacterized protein EPUS_00193 [Endocarpon pusillum Z07020]ERF75400.1 hypothetical protein EPUS_00193 [Endocarpon pusillum Z07020]